MQQIGSLAREVLANAKRAKEARDKLRLAGGLLGPAEIKESRSPVPACLEKAGSDAQGVKAHQAPGQHFTAEGVGGSDPATQKTAMGGGFGTGCGRAGLLDILRDDGKDTARPGTPDESLRQIANTYCDAPEDL